MAKVRTAPAWRRVFLLALGGSGNVQLAARTAGVDHSTAYQLRNRDAAFAERWAGAVARAAALASAGGLKAPVSGAAMARDAGGGMAGLVVRRSKNAGTQVVRAGPGRWSAGTERDFLEALAKTACVKRAAAAVPAAYLDAVASAYGGTGLGRQEIDGVLAADVEGSLWPAALIEACRGPAPAAETLRRVVIGVDPPASASGICGIVACGVDAEGVGHVLADHSAGGLSPEGWAAKVAGAAAAHGADRIVAEKNQGGDMVRSVLKGAGRTLPVRLVSASRGKAARAEPVAALFEARQARLAGRFAELEAELAGLVSGGGYQGPGRSPDRADAMVWALWALMIEGRAEPRVRMP